MPTRWTNIWICSPITTTAATLPTRSGYYLRRAGEAAQAAYANDAAIDYYQRVLPLLPPEEQVDVVRQLAGVMQLVGRWDEAERLFQEAMALAESVGDRSARAYCTLSIGELRRPAGLLSRRRWTTSTRAHAEFEELDDQAGIAQAMHNAGTIAAQQGDLALRAERYERALAIRRHDRRPRRRSRSVEQPGHHRRV